MLNLSEVELQFRFSGQNNTQIAKQFNVSSARIGQLAKQYGWKRETKAIELPSDRVVALSIEPKSSDDLANASISLAERLMYELNAVTAVQGELEEYILQITEGDTTEARRKIFLRAISLAERANTLKTISQILISTRGIVMPANEIGKGKKEQAIAAANQATAGRFAPSAPPLKAVK